MNNISNHAKSKKIDNISLDFQSMDNLIKKGLDYLENSNFLALANIANQILEADPKNYHGLLFGLIFSNFNSEYSKSLILGSEALKSKPNCNIVITQMAIAFQKIGKMAEAEAFLINALKIDPNYDRAIFELSRLYQSLSKNEKALTLINILIKKFPNNSNYYNSRGIILKNLNRKSEAMNSFKKSIYSGNNVNLSAIWNYVSSKKITKEDNKLISDIKKIYLSDEVDGEKKKSLAFALAKIFKDTEQYELAMDCWLTGNAILKEKNKSKSKSLLTKFSRYYSNQPLFTIKNITHEKDWFNENNKIPIFIVGMPRSGTSLTEQILGCHSEITPLGELAAIPSIVEPLKYNSAVDFHEYRKHIRQNYQKQLEQHYIPTKFFTDKLPTNYQYLGWLVNAFPEAKFIHTQRDPIATCFSIFTMNFSAEGLFWTYDMNDIASFYNEYKNLMQIMHKAFSDKLFTSNYEILVNDPENSIKEILKYIGVNYQKSCLNFHKSSRRVQTASSDQVNKPIYKNSSKNWENYKDWIKPLIQNIN